MRPPDKILVNNLDKRKPKDAKAAWRGIFGELKQVRLLLLVVVLMTVCTAGLSVASPDLQGTITDLLYDGITGSGIDFPSVYKFLVILAIVFILSYVLNYFKRVVVISTIQRVVVNLRLRIAGKINKLPLSYFDTHQKGDVMSRVTNDIDTFNSSLQQCLSQIVNAGLTVIFIAVMMFRINLILAIVVVFILPASMLLSRRLLTYSQRLFRKQQAAMGAVNAHIEETYSANIIVKSFGGKDTVEQDFDEKNNELRDNARKAQIVSGLFHPIVNLVSDLCFVLVCVLCGVFIVQGRISLGDMQRVTQYARRFGHPVSEIAGFANTLQSALAAYERISGFLAEEEQPPDAEDAIAPEHIKGDIEFRNVSFRYEDNSPVLENISFRIGAGQRVALVGNTGSGKSTITKLLLRFYDPQEGEIFIDGINIRQLRQERLHDAFGMVMQDIWLSDTSVKENIAYAVEDYELTEVEQAAQAAHAHRFISLLPEGYDHELHNGGEEFSHGQRQLLTIARAIFKKPEILLLDEATSSVDARTELLIQRIMSKFMQDRTSFVIAHRLSTIRSSDLILVMQNGRIVEQGNHEELLAKQGYYYQLHESQFADCL